MFDAQRLPHGTTQLRRSEKTNGAVSASERVTQAPFPTRQRSLLDASQHPPRPSAIRVVSWKQPNKQTMSAVEKELLLRRVSKYAGLAEEVKPPANPQLFLFRFTASLALTSVCSACFFLR